MIRSPLAAGGAAVLLALSATQAEAATAAPDRTRKESPIAVGTRLLVEGEFTGDGAFLAEEIEIRPGDDPDEELRGLLESVEPAPRRLRILGFTVQLEDDAVIRREPAGKGGIEDLRPGLRVRVDGRRAADGTFVADSVRIRERQHPERKIVGRVEAIESALRGLTVLRVLGLRVILNEATDVVGADGPVVAGRRGVLDEDDLLFTGRNRIGRRLMLAGELRLRAVEFANEELDGDPDDTETEAQFLGIVALAADYGRLFVYAEVMGEREYLLRGGDRLDEEGGERGTVRFGEAYVELATPGARGVAVALGRQKFNEAREWYYNNKNLDAVRVFADLSPFALEASISRDLFDDTRNLDDQERTNLILLGSYRPRRDLRFEAFFVTRESRTVAADCPRVLGLRAIGGVGKRLDFWVDVARQRGTRPDRATGQPRDIRAHGLDAGLTIRPRVALDPSFTVGYAFGSGDRPDGGGADGTDETFRQTGLHRNRDKWNGVVQFRYYGEVLDPELANLRVLTLAAGLRPASRLSFDLVFHAYRQDVAATRLVDADIDADPDGLDPDLGTEWDLIAGYEPSRQVEIRLIAGRFRPGPAFDGEATAATVLSLQSKFRF